LRRAVELNPRNVSARQWLSYYLVFVEGRFEEGIAQARRAVELDPLAPLLVMQLGMTLMGRTSRPRCSFPQSIWGCCTTIWAAAMKPSLRSRGR
jgi:hypothetical protein